MSLEDKRSSVVNMPVFYGGGRAKVVDGRLKVAELVIRCLICALAVLAAVLAGKDRQVKTFFSFEKKARFSDVKALVFLLIANVIAAGYSLIQGVRCIASLTKSTALFNKPLAWTIFICDQIMAYVMLSAVSAAVQSAVFSELGQADLQWIRLCDMYEKFCLQMGVAVAIAMVACLVMVVLSCISSFNLFRLYGKGKGKSTGW